MILTQVTSRNYVAASVSQQIIRWQLILDVVPKN